MAVVEMDRYWFLTWTTYGDRLPGDERGFVSMLRDSEGQTFIHNLPNTPLDADIPALQRFAQKTLKCPPIRLVVPQAESLLAQFQETANYRGWQLFAVGVMAEHVHIVVGVPGDPDPSDILGDFKSYGSRSLNNLWLRPKSGTWWTQGGSKRRLKRRENVLAAIKYVLEQEHPLLIWTAPIPELGLPGGRVIYA